ncbi:MAG TPA: hypothetical protein VID94_14120, partial [Acidimicrobiales bacterium]
TDELPAGQTYVDGSQSATPAAGTFTVSPDGRTLTWTYATLPDGENVASITYDVTIDADAAAPQTNEAEVCVAEALVDCAGDSVRVIPESPEITIVKTAGDAADGEVFATEPGNVTYTYVVTNSGPLALHDVTVTDDNGTPDDSSDDFEATCPETTLAAGADMTCTSTVEVLVDTTNVAVAHGLSPQGNPAEADDDADVDVLVHGLIIDKSNDAPIDATLHLPEAPVGSTVTYTLDYTFSGDPVTNGVIHDVLPAGVEYAVGTASSNDEFTFIDYDSATRTLTWTAPSVTKSGELTYQVTVLEEAEGFGPLTNVATISSDQTQEDDATSDIFVPTIPEAETSKPTPPQTDVFDGTGPMSGPGNSLLLMLGILGGLVVGLAFITPVPEVVRRRNRR